MGNMTIREEAAHVVASTIRAKVADGEQPTDEAVAQWAVDALLNWPGLADLLGEQVLEAKLVEVDEQLAAGWRPSGRPVDEVVADLRSH